MQSIDIEKKDVLRYTTLPGVIPRLKVLLGGFGYLPLFLAQIYRNLGLIPENHPYLNPANRGRFGIMPLIAVAINNLEFNKKNIDKVILLGLTIIAFMLFFLFGIGLVFSLFSMPVYALTTVLITDFPDQDIAFEILDRVFGVPDVYNSGIAIPTPFHTGLHALLEFYNTALFIIAAFILVYYIFSIVAETAISGTLFGQRFHKIWGPLRIVIALGLLVPMGDYGLSSAQYSLLYVAKFGSGLATNAWIGLNTTTDVTSPFGTNRTVTYTQPPYEFVDINGNIVRDGPFYVRGSSYEANGLIVHPKVPDVSALAAYIDLVYTCMYAYKQMYDFDIRPYFIKTERGVSSSLYALDTGLDPTAAINFYNNKDIVVYFGHQSDVFYPDSPGNVKTYCGELAFPYRNESYPEIEQLRWLYYWLVMARFTEPNLLTPAGAEVVRRSQSFGHKIVAHAIYPEVGSPHLVTPPALAPCGLGGNAYAVAIGPCDEKGIEINHRAYTQSQLRRDFAILSDFSISSFVEGDQSRFGPSDPEINRGWAAAGIWYNKIAEWNGDIVAAVSSMPYAKEFPLVLKKAKDTNVKANANVTPDSLYKLITDGTRDSPLEHDERLIHRALLEAYDYWNTDGGNDDQNIASKANPLEGGLAAIFGLTPVLSIRDQNHAHPLAQLSGIGRNLIENAITNLGLAFGASFVGGTMNAAATGTGAAYTGLSGFFTSLAYIGILLGVVLYYIIPFMPFLYSFFAVSGWVKSIFEAMVGVPLWALAHLRLKGDVLIPREAMSGYFLLLEIFVRPTLILFGLVATTAVFAATVAVLNSIWDLVTTNATGMNTSADITNITFYRNSVDQVFFLVLYIIAVYITATSVFKLIDQIPHSVIRWINAGVTSFGDMAKDPAEGLYQYASMATYKFGPKITEGVASSGEFMGSKMGLSDSLKKG